MFDILVPSRIWRRYFFENGDFAAAVMRATASMHPADAADTECYVDDPIITVTDTPSGNLMLDLVVAWWLVVFGGGSCRSLGMALLLPLWPPLATSGH